MSTKTEVFRTGSFYISLSLCVIIKISLKSGWETEILMQVILLTLYLGLFCWSRSASRISSVIWLLLFHFWFCCSLCCLKGWRLSGTADFIFFTGFSFPKTTTSHIFSHFNRQRFVNCSKLETSKQTCLQASLVKGIQSTFL